MHLFFELNGARKVCEIVRNVYIVDCPFINQVLLRHLMIIVQILIHLGLDGSRLLLYQFDQPKRFALILINLLKLKVSDATTDVDLIVRILAGIEKRNSIFSTLLTTS